MPNKMPRPGQLDRRIEIHRRTETRTATGGVETTWTCVARCSAKVSNPLTGNDEGISGDQEVATTRALFAIRYRDGLGPEMRILYGGSYYDILTPMEEIGRKQYLLIPAQKQV